MKREPNRWSRKGASWTLHELKQLGKVPDSVLARRTGRTIKEVVAERERRRLGLPTAPRRWTAREIRLLGRMNDNEVARRLRRTKSQVRTQRNALHIAPFILPAKVRRWTLAEIRWLGKLPDQELARKFERTRSSVRQQRISLHIPSLTPAAKRWTKEEDRLLGTM